MKRALRLRYIPYRHALEMIANSSERPGEIAGWLVKNWKSSSIQRFPRGVRIASCRYIGRNYFFAVSFASNFTAWRSP